MTDRPLGVAIISVLAIIGGVLGILAGIFFVLGGSLLGSLLSTAVGNIFGGSLTSAGGLIGLIFGALGIIVILLGVLYVLFGYGAWNGKKWAWILGIIFCVIDILMIVAGNIISLIIGVLVLIYLFRKNTKTYFKV
ncbi:MAG: hypothetical protein QXD23_00125 [Candidatus Micrarchaeaceae archaeon]